MNWLCEFLWGQYNMDTVITVSENMTQVWQTGSGRKRDTVADKEAVASVCTVHRENNYWKLWSCNSTGS